MMLGIIVLDWIYKYMITIYIKGIHNCVYQLNWILLKGLIGFWTDYSI